MGEAQSQIPDGVYEKVILKDMDVLWYINDIYAFCIGCM